MKRIIEATCSHSLQKAIKKVKFKVADYDLLILAYRHAPDYDTRLDLLLRLAAKTKDAATKAQAKRCIAFEKATWKRFISDEKDCIFEAKIQDAPDSPVERYITKTFEGALRKVRHFCVYYETALTERSRFTIEKRRLTDEASAEDFEEDWRSEASYRGDFVLIDVQHAALDHAELLGVACDGRCHGTDYACAQHPCFVSRAPRLPPFPKNLDIVRYAFDDAAEYGIYYGDVETDAEDDCAFLLSLYEDSFCGMRIQTKEQYYQRVSALHCHVPFPKLEVIKAEALSMKLQKNYRAFRRLYARFGGE